MKKFILFVLSLVMMFSFVACGEDSEKKDDSKAEDADAGNSIVDEALALVNDGKTKEAYSLLYKNKTDAAAKKMLGDFKVYYTKVTSDGETETYSFDDKGNIISRGNYRYENSYGNNGKLSTRIETYDDFGTPIKTEFFYDSNDVLVKSIESYEDGEYGTVIRTTEYSYNSAGLLIKATTTDNTQEGAEAEEFTYDSNNYLIKYAEIRREGTPDDVYSFKYDENGNLAEIMEEDVGKLDAVCKYTCDDLGNVAKEVITDYNEDGSVDEDTATTEYFDYVYFYCPNNVVLPGCLSQLLNVFI